MYLPSTRGTIAMPHSSRFLVCRGMGKKQAYAFPRNAANGPVRQQAAPTHSGGIMHRPASPWGACLTRVVQEYTVRAHKVDPEAPHLCTGERGSGSDFSTLTIRKLCFRS
jgi:hypothetical protein